jgi:transcriptional regulator with XRE-family HTH domain
MPARTKNKTKFGLHLESWRYKQGLTAAQAADKVGRTERTWFRWLHGETIPSAGDLHALANALGQDAHELWSLATTKS